jgi:hypothetical protein
MSIKEAAHNFHKKIWDSPNREEIRTVVGKLKSSTRGLGNKIYPTPMLGLLLYNQQGMKRILGRSAVEELTSWSERELKVLHGIHNQVLQFNVACLAPLVSGLPEAVTAINPYKEYPQVVSTEGFQDLLFTPEEATEVIRSFHAHTGFAIALSTLSSVKERPSVDYEQTILQLNSEIVEAGPGGNPQWVVNYEEAESWEHPEVAIFHHVAALLSIHNSLANLDQFIYQGLFQEELIRMDQKCIIEYMWTTRGAGPSMWVMHIPYGDMYLFEVTDLITVNVDGLGETHGIGDTLCVIHSQTIPGSETAPGILKMRMLDDQLNSYRYLFRE